MIWEPKDWKTPDKGALCEGVPFQAVADKPVAIVAKVVDTGFEMDDDGEVTRYVITFRRERSLE